MKLILGKIYELKILDHESDHSKTDAQAKEKEPCEVTVWGKLVKNSSKTIVLTNWVSEDDQDTYTIIKKAVLTAKELK